jgi:hypothetical protein
MPAKICLQNRQGQDYSLLWSKKNQNIAQGRTFRVRYVPSLLSVSLSLTEGKNDRKDRVWDEVRLKQFLPQLSLTP